MPIKDVDGGLPWNGYSPRLFTGQLPAEQYVSVPFYFGGSAVPTGLDIPKSAYQGSGVHRNACRIKCLKKMPNMRK
jgi:hypothetical protein